jgi:hypothetical protein
MGATSNGVNCGEFASREPTPLLASSQQRAIKEWPDFGQSPTGFGGSRT